MTLDIGKGSMNLGVNFRVSDLTGESFVESQTRCPT